MAKAPPITAEMLEGLDETIDTRLADLKRLKRSNRKRIVRNLGSALRPGDQPMETGAQDPSARWKRQMELYDKEKEILDSLTEMEGDLLKLQEEKGIQSREYIAKAAQIYGSMVELRAAELDAELDAQSKKQVEDLKTTLAVMEMANDRVLEIEKDEAAEDSAAKEQLATLGFFTSAAGGKLVGGKTNLEYNELLRSLSGMTPAEQAAMERVWKAGTGQDLRVILDDEQVQTALGDESISVDWTGANKLEEEREGIKKQVSDYKTEVTTALTAAEKDYLGTNISPLISMGHRLVQLSSGLKPDGTMMTPGERRELMKTVVPQDEEDSYAAEYLRKLHGKVAGEEIPVEHMRDLEASLAADMKFQQLKAKTRPAMGDIEFLNLLGRQDKKQKMQQQENINREYQAKTMLEEVNAAAAEGGDAADALTGVIAQRRGKRFWSPFGRDKDKRPSSNESAYDQWAQTDDALKVGKSLQKEIDKPSEIVAGARHESDPNAYEMKPALKERQLPKPKLTPIEEAE